MSAVEKRPRTLSGPGKLGQIASLMSLLGRAASFAMNFVRERTRESCTRLCAVMCIVTGCVGWLAIIVFGFVHPDHAQTVFALVSGVPAMIGGGGVAIICRQRKPTGDTESAPSAAGPVAAAVAPVLSVVAGGAAQ